MTATAPTIIHLAVGYGFVALLIWVAACDVQSFVIPNRLCLAIAGLWPAFALTDAGHVAWLGAPLVALAAFAVGFALFAARLMGGGDVKLMAAIALWAGPGLVLPFIVITSLVGGALSIVVLVASRLQPVMARADGAARRSLFRANVPYGAAIAAGGLFVAGRLVVAG